MQRILQCSAALNGADGSTHLSAIIKAPYPITYHPEAIKPWLIPVSVSVSFLTLWPTLRGAAPHSGGEDMGKYKDNPRRANGWKRDNLIKRKKALGAPCHLCGYPIPLHVHYMDKRAFVLDELVPISRGGQSTWENTAGAHRCCNAWRGAKPVTAKLKAQIRKRYEREVLGITRSAAAAVVPVRAPGKATVSSRKWDA